MTQVNTLDETSRGKAFVGTNYTILCRSVYHAGGVGGAPSAVFPQLGSRLF
jgi:hypothetical protein